MILRYDHVGISASTPILHHTDSFRPTDSHPVILSIKRSVPHPLRLAIPGQAKSTSKRTALQRRRFETDTFRPALLCPVVPWSPGHTTPAHENFRTSCRLADPSSPYYYPSTSRIFSTKIIRPTRASPSPKGMNMNSRGWKPTVRVPPISRPWRGPTTSTHPAKQHARQAIPNFYPLIPLVAAPPHQACPCPAAPPASC